VVSALVAGRMHLEGRERAWMAAAILVEAAGFAIVIAANAFWVAVAAAAVVGLASGPFDVSVFTLRQRRTDPAQYGRAFAISMALNHVGEPVGSAGGAAGEPVAGAGSSRRRRLMPRWSRAGFPGDPSERRVHSWSR